MVAKLETIIVVRDLGMEDALQRTYEKHYAPDFEPQFIQSEESTLTSPPSSSGGFTNYGSIPKPVATYMNPSFKPRVPLFPFPESIMGFPEKAQTVFLFLACPASFASNPLTYFHQVINDKAIHYKVISNWELHHKISRVALIWLIWFIWLQGIRLTNCMFHTLRRKSTTFAILIVVKALQQAVHLVRTCRKESAVRFGILIRSVLRK